MGLLQRKQATQAELQPSSTPFGLVPTSCLTTIHPVTLSLSLPPLPSTGCLMPIVAPPPTPKCCHHLAVAVQKSPGTAHCILCYKAIYDGRTLFYCHRGAHRMGLQDCDMIGCFGAATILMTFSLFFGVDYRLRPAHTTQLWKRLHAGIPIHIKSSARQDV